MKKGDVAFVIYDNSIFQVTIATAGQKRVTVDERSVVCVFGDGTKPYGSVYCPKHVYAAIEDAKHELLQRLHQEVRATDKRLKRMFKIIHVLDDEIAGPLPF